jgi:hypothetical protein
LGHNDILVDNALIQEVDFFVHDFAYVQWLHEIELHDSAKAVDQLRSHVFLDCFLYLPGGLVSEIVCDFVCLALEHAHVVTNRA